MGVWWDFLIYCCTLFLFSLVSPISHLAGGPISPHSPFHIYMYIHTHIYIYMKYMHICSYMCILHMRESRHHILFLPSLSCLLVHLFISLPPSYTSISYCKYVCTHIYAYVYMCVVIHMFSSRLQMQEKSKLFCLSDSGLFHFAKRPADESFCI